MKTAAIELQQQLGTSWWGKRQRSLLAKVLAPLANAKIGSLTVTLPNKSQLSFGDQSDERLAPSVILNNWKGLRKAFSGGSVGWSEAFMDGDWDCPNLAALVEWIVVNEEHFGDMLASGKTKQWLQRLQHRDEQVRGTHRVQASLVLADAPWGPNGFEDVGLGHVLFGEAHLEKPL